MQQFSGHSRLLLRPGSHNQADNVALYFFILHFLDDHGFRGIERANQDIFLFGLPQGGELRFVVRITVQDDISGSLQVVKCNLGDALHSWVLDFVNHLHFEDFEREFDKDAFQHGYE